LIHQLTQLVNDRGGVVLLLRIGKAPHFVENDLLLVGGGALALLGFGYRCNKLRAPANFENLLRRLPVGV